MQFQFQIQFPYLISVADELAHSKIDDKNFHKQQRFRVMFYSLLQTLKKRLKPRINRYIY